MTQKNDTPRLRNFSLEEFKKASSGMVAKNAGRYGSRDPWSGLLGRREYTREEIESVIRCGNPLSMRNLSRKFYNENGIYRQIITYYATLLKNMGVLVPNLANGSSLQDSPVSKRYYGAVNLVEEMKLKKLLTRISQAVLVDGMYCGILSSLSKTSFAILDLPLEYCQIRYQTDKGVDIVEFNVEYFNSIAGDSARRKALSSFPKAVSSYYRSWTRGVHKNCWMFLPEELAVSFQLFDDRPYFLPLIPDLLDYENAVEMEAKKAADEIKKILVQKIPHLSDGTLLFEPEESAVMHAGVVDMLADSNPDVAVMTTYGEVKLEQSKSSDSITHTALDQMSQHVYTNAGVSPQLFAATNSSSLAYSLKKDTALMMVLGNKYADFITSVVDRVFGNGRIHFSYIMTSVTQFNEQEFITNSHKLAQSGYPFLLSSLAQGISQRDLVNIKTLENDLLGLTDKLLPLRSSHTISGDEATAGRPEKAQEEKSDKTEKNKESLGNS